MSASTTNEVRNEPWYRQGWPWFLIMFPAIAVVCGTITAVLAYTTWDGLVTDDYYKEGQTVVKVIDRLQHAQQMGLSAVAKVSDGAVSVKLEAADKNDLPATLYLTIVHPTHSGYDQTVVLQKGQDGAYSGEIAPLRAGHWRFQLENELKGDDKTDNENEPRSWRMNGAANLPTETEVLIKPSDS
ncbi:MAG: FixH family protein [Azoarcus sp.]|jgi:hypothetical protein|nr:FixH family protein [Azoarcus sp.]